jgi:hypothetical protein
MASPVVVLAVVTSGVSAGALLAEGAVLIRSWRSMAPERFLAWYRENAVLLVRFYGTLEIVALASVALAVVTTWLGGDPAWRPLAVATFLTVLVLGVFPLYFQRVNASFAAGTIPVADVGPELRRYAAWHWVRVMLAVAAFATATLTLAR